MRKAGRVLAPLLAAILVPLATANYILVADPTATCDFIKTASECELAAQNLGLSDTTAYLNNGGQSTDPPYCYEEGGSLKFDGAGTNSGQCGYVTSNPQHFDRCLCKNSPRCTRMPEEKYFSDSGAKHPYYPVICGSR